MYALCIQRHLRTPCMVAQENGSYHCSWNLMHFCSRGSWAWVKLINKQARKLVLFYKLHCFLKIFIRLSWKTTDDVCSNCYSRHSVKKVARNTELRSCKSLAPLKASVHRHITLQLYLQKLRPKMIFGKKK